MSSSDSDGGSSDGYETPPDATEGYIEPRPLRPAGSIGRERTYTANLVTGNVRIAMSLIKGNPN